MNKASVTEATPEVLFKSADWNEILWSTWITAARRHETWNNAGGHVRKTDRLVDANAF